MSNYKIKDGYKCDRQSKYDFTASTVNFIQDWAGTKNVTIRFMEFDKNGNLVEFDATNSDSQSRTDLIMLYNGVKYVIELKERWGKYASDYYGKDDDEEGWMLNIDKVTELKKIDDAIPLYVNLFPDGMVRVWNLNKITEYQTITKNIHRATVEYSEIKKQDRYELWNKDSICIPRKKGSKSNGVWVS